MIYNERCRNIKSDTMSDINSNPNRTSSPSSSCAGSSHPSLQHLIICIEKTIPSLTREVASPNGGNRSEMDDLSSWDEGELGKKLNGIMSPLNEIDAQSILALQPRSEEDGGSPTGRWGTHIRPIHEAILPPPDPKLIRDNFVRYLHVTESPSKYCVGIFVFSPHARIPLHDHPNMCVLTRVLYGEVTVRSYDVITEDHEPGTRSSSQGGGGLLSYLRSSLTRSLSFGSVEPTNRSNCVKVRKKSLINLKAPDTTVLYPRCGNMHEFTAGDRGAAVLDILLPPYDLNHDRDCSYYRESCTEEGNADEVREGDACWLVPVPQCSEFHCVSGRYLDLGYRDDS